MKVLFFSPHSETWVHAFPEALVAEVLQQHGHKVEFVTCGRLLDEFCIPMASHGLLPSSSPSEKDRICCDCQANASLLRRHMSLNGEILSELVSQPEREDIARSLESLDRKSIFDLKCDGISVGRLSLFNTIIRYKRIDLDFTDTEWDGYLSDVRTTLYALRASKVLLDRHSPDRIIVYNSLYAVNGVMRHLAEQRGIPSYFVHAGQNLSNRLGTIIIGRGDPYSFTYHLMAEWPKYATIPCDHTELSLVTDHILELLGGKSGFVYSSPKSREYFDVRKYFGVSSTQKLVVAVLSSYDEALASQSAGAMRPSSAAAFDSQIEWVRALVEFASGRPDLFIIVRVHPRELANRRDSRQSQHARLLMQALECLPPNVAINWPKDGVAVYDLAGEADVFLNAWSTVGKEVSFLGIPVVGYLKDMGLYPDSLNYIETDAIAYFTTIDSAISEGWSFEGARRAYRWGSFEYVRTLFFIDDGYSEGEHASRNLIRRVFDRLMRSVDHQFKKRLDCWRRASPLKASERINKLLEAGASSVLELDDFRSESDVSLKEESEYLSAELRRVALAMFPSVEAQQKNRLFQKLASAGQ